MIPQLRILFKDKRQAEEFLTISPALMLLLCDLALFVYRKYRFILTITDLIRTQPEQDEIYLNHIDPYIREEYKKKPWPSVHQFRRGADVRFNFPPGWLKEILDYMNDKYPYDPSRPKKKTIQPHNAGSGEHLHLQTL